MNKEKLRKFSPYILTFIISFIFGNGIFFDESINSPGEVTVYTIPFAVTMVLFFSLGNMIYSLIKKNTKGYKILTVKSKVSPRINKSSKNTTFINIPTNSYKLRIYYDPTYSTYVDDKDLESYYDFDKSSYNFKNHKLIKEIPLKFSSNLIISRVDLYESLTNTRGNFIITTVYDDVEFDAMNPGYINYNGLTIITPDKKSILENIDKVLEQRKVESEIRKKNLIEKQNQKDKAKLKKIEKQNKIKEEEQSRQLKLSSVGLSANQIKRLIDFYDREIIKENYFTSGFGLTGTLEERINKLNDSKYLENEFELSVFLSKDLYVMGFNPAVEKDRYSMETMEFDILNDLGMVDQLDSFPYLVTVKDIRLYKNWSTCSTGNRINIVRNDGIQSKLINNGLEFESHVAELLVFNGFTDVVVSKATGDQGVDIFATSSNLAKYGFQAKYYTGTVGNAAVQEIIAGINYYKLNVGVVITNSTFTKSAQELAASSGVLLWDYEKVKELEKSMLR